MRGLNFAPLPGTRAEANSVHQLLGRGQADLYIGKAALEDVLMQSHGPKILHLATHGFFLSDQGLIAAKDDARGITILSTGEQPHPVKSENPLLRSGIALAGANRALRAEGLSNGIVTADKILNLKLKGTEMVVLSACDTGLGEIRSGEGVFGLRRAFTQAGAKSLVMSMWSVPDRETQELMTGFYGNLKTGGMTRGQALRKAALQEMTIVKARYGTADPFYWGAFVFLGEP
jgi:CHAT domain-containing protein